MKVVLTVPHAISDKPDREHFRDVLAPGFSNLLHENLPGSTLVMGNRKREEVDLNRKVARPTHFREEIREALKNDDILIDVHSFDESAETRTPYDIVLLYHPDHSDLSFHKHLLDGLKEDGFRASVFWNEYGCDIINEFPDNTSVLVEVNEQIDNIQDLAESLARAISSWTPLENPRNFDVIAYHGSNSKIANFKVGSYFTENKEEALYYARQNIFNVLRGHSGKIYLYKVRLKDANWSLDWNNEVNDTIMEESEKYDDLDKAIEDGIKTAKQRGLNFITFEHPSSYENDMYKVYVLVNRYAVETLEIQGGQEMIENPMKRWQVYDSNMDPSEKHPYQQIAHQYDSSNLKMKAINAKESSFDFVDKLYEDSVVTIKMDGEYNICVYNRQGSPPSNARGKKGMPPVGLRTVFSTLNTLKWGFPVLDEIQSVVEDSDYEGKKIHEIVFAGELVRMEGEEMLRGGTARAFVGNEGDVHYFIFDIISINGTRVQGDYVSRMALANRIIKRDNLVHVVYWEDGGRNVAKRIWEDIVVPKGHEGLVVRSVGGGSITKVKIVHPIDCMVVGWKEGSGRLTGNMGALLLSLRDEEGVYRFNCSVGTGFKDVDRRWWKTEMQKIETGQTKVVDGDTYNLVDPTKSKIIEIQCNEFSPQMNDAYDFRDGQWKYADKRFTHIFQKPRMIGIRDDKVNSVKALRLEQIPDYEPQNVFESDITTDEIKDNNAVVVQVIFDEALKKAKKSEYKVKQKEFKEQVEAGVSYEDVGSPMSPDFLKRAFVPEKSLSEGWQPWFAPEERIETEVKVDMGVPEFSMDIPRVGKPRKRKPSKWEE